MSLTITATFDEPTGSVDLVATSGVDHAAGDYVLTRTDARGTATVRTQAGLGFSGGQLILNDAECALGGLVTYQITAASETATDSLTPETDREWLTFPIFPQLSIEAPKVGGYETSWEPRDVWFDVLDRDDRVPVFGQFGIRQGHFSFLAPDYDTALAVVAAYKRIRVAYLRLPDPPAASMYHTVERLTVRRFRSTASWLIEGLYREVARPSGDLLGTLGWTFDDITALGQSFDELSVTFPTFNDMTAGVS